MYPSLMLDLLGFGADPRVSVEMAARHGFEGVDLRLNREGIDAGSLDVASLKASMRDAGLRPGYCSLLTNKIGVDAAAWEENFATLHERALLARELGYTRTSSVILPFHDELNYEACFEMHVERVTAAAEVFAAYEIALGVEYVSPDSRRRGKPNEFIHTMPEAMRLVRACGENVGLMLDSFHWHCAEETADDILAMQASDVVVVHLNDAPAVPLVDQSVMRREMPGATGVIDLPTFLGSLAGIGYDGPITLEPTHERWPAMDRDEVLALAAESLKDALKAVPA
ncbi:MAG: sugar phosphate isomerase/epimerase family protein [Planctomycetota bacterium]